MRWHWAYIVSLCGAVWGVSQPALAGDCGARQRPSQQASCVCKARPYKGTLRIAGGGSARACLQAAVAKAKLRCGEEGAATLKWKPVGAARRGKCGISFTCQQRLKKKSALQWARRKKVKRGVYTHRFKRRMRPSTNECAQAAKVVKRRSCKRSAQARPLRFSWRKLRHRVRYFMGFKRGYCKIAWTCAYKARQRVFWCE